ncbi:MAG: FAD-dependent oxidoreductase [Clostridia bacterium]|nr:FAD-dependent oxidoreductase [Clostridia bacterium]
MMNRIAKFFILLGIALIAWSCDRQCDVLIIGGGAGGVSAGVQASRLGANTILVEPGPWLGGMLTSSGVGGIDGNHNMHAGLFGEFCDSLAGRYGGYDALNSGWVSQILFEPKVAADVFRNMTAKEPKLEVMYNTVFNEIEQTDNGWTVSLSKQDGKAFKVKAKILIDGTELGDVAAAVRVPYRLGMDARADTGESIAPEEANHILQDLTYVCVLRNYGPDADVTMERPADYDSTLYVGCTGPGTMENGGTVHDLLGFGRLPSGNQYMLNWPTRGNDIYLNVVEMNREQREEALKAAKAQTFGFVYYLQTAMGQKNIGIDYDEFPTDDGLALFPYYREARRTRGEVLFTMDYVARPYDMPLKLYKEGIAVGDYPVDHHHGRYADYEGLPDLHFYPVPSFNLPIRALVPAGFDNLLVADKAISVSNIVNGTTRLQPVIMQVGQAAGTIAALAVRSGRTVDQICGVGRYENDTKRIQGIPEGVREVQQVILDGDGYIMPYIDLKPTDDGFEAIQKVGACGILRGDGISMGWENITVFRINDPLLRVELVEGLQDDYPDLAEKVSLNEGEAVSVSELPGILLALGGDADQVASVLDEFNGARPNDRPLSRLEFSVLLDRTVDLFGTRSAE